eukprot:358020-Chlamydomonas_euryale.AAC.10
MTVDVEHRPFLSSIPASRTLNPQIGLHPEEETDSTQLIQSDSTIPEIAFARCTLEGVKHARTRGPAPGTGRCTGACGKAVLVLPQSRRHEVALVTQCTQRSMHRSMHRSIEYSRRRGVPRTTPCTRAPCSLARSRPNAACCQPRGSLPRCRCDGRAVRLLPGRRGCRRPRHRAIDGTVGGGPSWPAVRVAGAAGAVPQHEAPGEHRPGGSAAECAARKWGMCAAFVGCA